MTFALSDNGLLKTTLETIRDAVLITDSELEQPGPTIIYANTAFCDLTGYALEELVGQTPRLLQGPESDPELMQTLRRQLLAGERFSGETVNYRKDGSPFRIEWTIRPFPTEGTPRYFIAAQRDVSALRDLEQQRLQLQTLAEIQTRVGTAGLELQALRDQVVQTAMAVTGADGAAIEEASDGEMVYTAACGRASDSLGLRLPISKSLSGVCFQTREPIHCRDTHQDPRVAREAADRVGFRSGLVVPLTHQELCFGVLKVYADRPNAFSEADLNPLNMASQMLAASLADARRFKGERDRRNLLVDALPLLISFVDKRLHYREVNLAYTHWYQRPAGEIVGKPVADVMGEMAFEKIHPYMLAALSGEQVTFETHFPHPEGNITPIEVDLSPLRGSDGDIKGFYALVRDISDRKRAERDYLTNAFNRRGFEERLEQACATAWRYQRPLTLIFLDLDHFKSINDRFGHGVGDEVLRDAASTLFEEVRDSDTVSRWGGEEFLILAPETSRKEAGQLAERLRRAIAARSHPVAGGITASFGVAALAPEETGSDFVRRADQALYAAKAAGRNRIEYAE